MNLSYNEQASFLWENGVHIGERDEPEHKVLLYQIGGFYIEMFYNPINNTIKRIHSFSSVD
jgi:hypothetical protein